MSSEPVSEIGIVPLSPAIGAEIGDVDLSETLDDGTFATIYQAWLDYGVLRFRGQRLGDADLVAFSRRFGDLDPARRSPSTAARLRRWCARASRNRPTWSG